MSQIFDPATLGTVNNQITFNDFTAKPVFKVQQTRPTQQQIREQDVPIPNNNGVSDFMAFEGKLHFLISGTMYPLGEDEFYRGIELLRKVGSLEEAQADPLSDYGYVPYIWKEFNRQRMMFVKVLYVDGLGESSGKGYQQPFTFICKVKNPVTYDVTPVTTTLGVNTTGTPIGTSAYPLKYPVLYGKTTYAGVGNQVVNAGSLGAYPTFNINGPINVPRITNTTTGEFIEVNVNLPTTSDILTIAYDNDTPPAITYQGNSVYNKLTAGSTFWKVKSGANSLALTGSSMSNGASATVNFYSTYPL